MSLLNPLSEEDKTKYFTHKGWVMYVVPVYLDFFEEPTAIEGEQVMQVTARNGVPEWTLLLALGLWHVFTVFYPASPPILVTGEL